VCAGHRRSEAQSAHSDIQTGLMRCIGSLTCSRYNDWLCCGLLCRSDPSAVRQLPSARGPLLATTRHKAAHTGTSCISGHTGSNIVAP
jgi:hypothetical protein